MKIVIISPFQNHLSRGIERFTFSIANIMAKQGHDVIIYAWKSENKFSWGKTHDNVTLKLCPNFKYYQRSWIGYYYNYLLRKDNPDRVYLNFLYHGEINLNKNFKYYYVLNSPSSQVKVRYEFIKNHYNLFDDLTFVAVSEMVKREALPYIGNNRCEVVYNGVDLDLFKPVYTKQNESEPCLKLITTAAFEERKGIQYMIKALSSYSNLELIKFNIYGKGPYASELNRLVSYYKLGNYITINDAVDNIEKILPENDVFILLSNGEAMPIAPIEAMASGLALLVSDFDPYPEFVNASFGYMVDREDVKQIHEVLDELLQKQKLEQLKTNARKAAEQFSWEKAVQLYLSI
jgi:glycosyltransferase involved in cell wall biosynthesis